MPLSKHHKDRTRARILESAGRTFRRRGFSETSIGDVMRGAGLTHGGFYAHFRSKDALLTAVVAIDHGLIRQLAARSVSTSSGWTRATHGILRDYLDPAHLEIVREGCTFAALTADAVRVGGPVRAAYEQAFCALVGELLRGPRESAVAALAGAGTGARRRAVAAAATAIGAVIVASGLSGSFRDAVLDAAYRHVLGDLAHARRARAPRRRVIARG